MKYPLLKEWIQKLAKIKQIKELFESNLLLYKSKPICNKLLNNQMLYNGWVIIIMFPRLKKKSEVELQQIPNSSSNLVNAMSSPRMFQQPTRRDSVASSYNSLIIKQIRAGISLQQSAHPPSSHDYSFERLFPFVVFSVFCQPHVIYLIIISGFLMLKYCDAHWQMLTVQLSLTLAYICLQIICRFFTFKFYTKEHFFHDSDIYYWDRNHQQWQSISQQNIKVGQILKIRKKQNKLIQQSQTMPLQVSKVRVPVNILPMRVSSKQKQVSIQTFDTNKQQAATKISIIKYFSGFFAQTHYKTQLNLVNERLYDQCIIKYTFCNPISQSFQASVQFIYDTVEKQITNSDTIPRGAFFLNEQQLVGLVLYNLQEKNLKHLKHTLGSKNSITALLKKHLVPVIGFNVLISLLLLALNALISFIFINTTFASYFHCYFFNYFSLLCFSMNVVMYIILGLHQIIDSFLIRHKCDVRMNNYIKSVDQFGVADTFVLDQFSFVKKNILQVNSIQLNIEQSTNMFTQQIILIIVQKSAQLYSKFQNKWLSLTHYYRSRYVYPNSRLKEAIIIKEQKIDMNGSVRLAIVFQNLGGRQFIFRFNQKVIFSILESMTIQKQIKFSEKIQQGKLNGQLMLMVEILELKDYGDMDISFLMYELQFKFLSLIKLKFIPQSRAVDFLRYLKNKYNIVIMASSSFQYFQNILVSAGLKNQRDRLMMFEETEENDFQRQLNQKIQQYKKVSSNQTEFFTEQEKWRKGSYVYSEQNYGLTSQVVSINMGNMRKTLNPANVQEQQKQKPNLIVAIHSSLIVYLCRTQIRSKLRELSKTSTYIIFYSCTQFQKQLCAASIFKIFPQHIFMSNFAIDANIIRISNLSVCMARHSAERYSTATVGSYQSLQKFISKQCVTSIELTTIIIKSHIFKNQCLAWSMIIGMLLVYEGRLMYTGLQYCSYMMYLYNAAFTILPIFYYLIARPELVGDIMVQDYKDYKLRYQHVKGIISGILITYITYSIMPDLQMEQTFVAIMINCTWMGNFYHLVIDDSVKKRNQAFIIMLQCIISIGGYFLSLLVSGTYNLFNIDYGVYPQSAYQSMFFCLVLLINPLIIFLLFFFMSFHKSIHTKDQRNEKQQELKQEMQGSIKKQNIIGRVSKSNGKQMKFRRLQARSEFY